MVMKSLESKQRKAEKKERVCSLLAFAKTAAASHSDKAAVPH